MCPQKRAPPLLHEDQVSSLERYAVDIAALRHSAKQLICHRSVICWQGCNIASD